MNGKIPNYRLEETYNVYVEEIPTIITGSAETKVRKNIGNSVEDGCTRETPPILCLQAENALSRLREAIAHDLSLVQYDTVPFHPS